jgi:TolA-binding protein
MILPIASLLIFDRASSVELRTTPAPRFRRASSATRPAVLGVALWCCAIAGCKSPLDKVDINDTYGPTGRKAQNIVEQAERDVKGDTRLGLEEFNAAEKLYEEQKYAEARKAMAQIIKKYKKQKAPIVNDALFYQAECDYHLANYPAAQDGYTELLKVDGKTKYFEQCINRLFAIGRYWLDAPKPASEIELASFEDEQGAEKLKDIPEASIPFTFPLTPNFTDKTRPMFDTQGRGVQALKSVYMNDVTGPKADEALMILATFHLRKKDYREADINFKTIRDNFDRKSKYLAAAYILGAHASLKSYQGAQYDGKQLEEAKKLATQAIHLFPEAPQRAKLEADLRRIDAEAAARAWTRVDFHLRRADTPLETAQMKQSEKKAAAVYCETIIDKYPESPQAGQAREVLIKLGPEYSAGILKKSLFPKQPAKSKAADQPYDEPQEPGRLHISDKEAKPISQAK